MPNTYTSQAELARRQAMMEAMNSRQTTGQGIGGGLANMLRRYRGGKENAALAQAEATNEQIASDETQALINTMRNNAGGQLQGPPTAGGQQPTQQFQTPGLQNIQLQRAMKQQETAQELAAQQAQTADQRAYDEGVSVTTQANKMELERLKQKGRAQPLTFEEQIKLQELENAGKPRQYTYEQELALRNASRAERPGDFNKTAGYYMDSDGNAVAERKTGANGQIVVVDLATNQPIEAPPTNSTFVASAALGQLSSTTQSRLGEVKTGILADREREVGAAELETAKAEWEALSPLRVEEDGAIYQNRSDVALSEWETKKSREFEAEMSENVRLNNAEIRSYEDSVARFEAWTNEAIDAGNAWNTGFFGNMVSAIKGTPAYNLRATLQSMAAFAGFENLNDMRQRSPTGGALGNVSDTELGLLVSAFGSLDQGQSPTQFRRKIIDVEEAVQKILRRKIDLGESFSNPWSTEPVSELAPVGRFQVEVVD